MTVLSHACEQACERWGGGGGGWAVVVCMSFGPWLLKCLIHDGQGPSDFHSKLLILSHQHEMLIVRQSESRRLRFVCSSQALISAGAAGFGFPNDSPAVPVLSDLWKHILGIPSCSISVRPISDVPLWCSSVFTRRRKRNTVGTRSKKVPPKKSQL